MPKIAYPPGPRSLPGVNLWAMQRDPIGFLKRVAHDYGDITHFKITGAHYYLLNDPELIKQVLVVKHASFRKGRGLQRAKLFLGEGLLTAEGEFHRRQRRIAQAAFHRDRILSYGRTMVDFARRTSYGWEDGRTIDVRTEMARLTLAIAAKTLFDADVDEEAADIGRALSELLAMFNIAFLSYGDVLNRLPLPRTIRFRRARARLDQTVYRLIDHRRRSGADHGDLLSMLMLAEDHEGGTGSMTDTQLRDETMTLLLAGHETTANALTWTWYLLAHHPEVEQRLHDEIDSVLGDRLPGPEDVPQLRYTEMVLAESMRLYPPAWIVGRMALRDEEIGGYVIPRDAVVLFSQYLTHRDSRFFPEPERFDPLRFTTEAKAARPKFAYFPFGGGPRTCIGEGFAWMEGVLLLATLAQRWRLAAVGNAPVRLQPLITLRPADALPMRLETRLPGAAQRVSSPHAREHVAINGR